MGRLPEWLADPALGPVWAQVAERLERRSLSPVGRIRFADLDRPTRHALAGLLGRPLVSDRVTVELSELDALLRERSEMSGLRAVVEAALGRGLRDRAADRSARAVNRELPFGEARAWIDAHPDMGWAEEWLAILRRTGLLSRLPDPAVLVVRALEILACRVPAVLPNPTGAAPTRPDLEPITRTELAAHHTGNAHALDDDEPLGQLVLRGLAVAAEKTWPLPAAERRALWQAYGVQPDSVSTTCLMLGLRPGVSHPVHLTPWELRRQPLRPEASAVLVCENPSVLEAFAERWGAAVPVVCTAGEPNLVTLDVLGALAASGARLSYHGDFDWPGVGIANRLVRRVGVIPWRMTVADYEAATRRNGPPLAGSVVEPLWDASLGHVMRTRGVAVHEEAVLSSLVDGWVRS